jgi:putative CocE/NonD family hydrolase
MRNLLTSYRIVQLVVISFVGLVAIPCAAQQFNFPSVAVDDPEQLSKAMPRLAREVTSVYQDDDRSKYLDNMFRLQIVAGQYGDAVKTLTTLRALRANSASPQAGANNVQYEIFARARANQSEDGSQFDQAFQRAFREVLGRLDDRTSALVLRGLNIDQSAMQRDLRGALSLQKGKDTISLANALRLIRSYQEEEAYRSFTPLTAALIAEDDHRRYIIGKDIPVKTKDGATVCALVVRPRAASGRLPALLEFTIYADGNGNLGSARRSASNGYAGVVGLTRGKGCSPDKAVPYEHDGLDAAALIDWISAQPWSDHQVGMYGGSYSGFTPWAAAKHMPKALKAIMAGAPVAPGIDVPMESNVFWNFVYPWTFYTTNEKTLDNATYNDNARWARLNREWYVSGRAYRDLDKIDGTPNPIFDQWIAHPAYDSYWQDMIPYKKEFARINIPVLATAGYYFGGPGGALYYFLQHYKYNPKAEHYLVIGPYDHIRGHSGTVGALGGTFKVLAGYELDPVAQLDMGELRYQWFDYVFKGGPKPALLKDKVNYEVMGANVWKHAPSLAAMGDQKLRFHLSAMRAGDAYRLSESKPADDVFITQTVDLANRSDVDRVSPGGGIVDKVIDTLDSIEFVSDPLLKPTELSGLFSGRLDFITNKQDFDFNILIYELTPNGEYVQLSPYWARASYIRDPGHRQLLSPGKRTQVDFESGRLTSRQFQAGSRLVVLLQGMKSSGMQINYGTGKDVSDETIADAKEKLLIRWFSDSYIDVPVRR